MEFCNGGDLADYLQAKKTLSEDSIRHLSIHIASALVFIHQQHIIHRDIKPQNILLCFPQGPGKQFKDASIKIADFGFARYLFEADMAATMCGSPIYMAPEILMGHKYDSKADMWSTGVILYQCLTGNTPFYANDPHSLRKQYIRNSLVPRIPPGVSSLLSDLLLQLVKKSPQERMSQGEFQSHPFLKVHVKSQEILSTENSLSLHARSSPVPINRPNNSPVSSSNRSPKNSPHAGRLSYGSQKGFSASSGPPNSSLHKYYSSPPTNVTDEGFILVGTPGAQPQGSLSPFSLDGSVGSSSQNSSPLGSLTHQHNFLYSPHPPLDPSNTGFESALSHTPPFSSLFKTSGSLRNTSLPMQQRPPLQATPLNFNHSPDSSQSPTLSSSPGKKSHPVSRTGSHTKLATLVESRHEETDHMIDSMDMITPSLLLESDLLRDELERLSNPSKANEGIVFGLLKTMPEQERESRKFSKGLNLSQELADIRKRDMSLSQKRSSLFQIGDSSDEQDLPGGMFGRSGSPSSPEEMFALQLEEDGDSPVHSLQQNILLANELLRIAKTRQGPMLLLSSSMGDSGGMVDHVVRFSEQLVLCVKAATVVKDGVRQYNIANAVHSSDPFDAHKKELAEAETLELLCLEKARTARDLYHKCLAKRRRHSLPNVNVTAEKLIFFQAADLCKQALLEEKNHKENVQCLKKYRLAYMLLKLLQSDANSPNDRNTMKKYISLIQHRQKLLTFSS